MPKLTYAISTLGNRLHAMTPPPSHADVHVLIVWQKPEETPPEWTNRSDVTLIAMEETGLSKSRNKAIEHCTTPYLWIADDDITPRFETVLSLCDKLDQDTTIDVLVGRIQTPDGHYLKSYNTPATKPLKKHQVAGVSSIEIVLRMDTIRRTHIKFDTQFGLGAKWTMGEEFIFLADLIGQKGTIQRVTDTLAVHPLETTGKNYSDPKVWKASSAAILRALGPGIGTLARIAMLTKKRKAVRTWKDRMVFLTLKP